MLGHQRPMLKGSKSQCQQHGIGPKDSSSAKRPRRYPWHNHHCGVNGYRKQLKGGCPNWPEAIGFKRKIDQGEEGDYINCKYTYFHARPRGPKKPANNQCGNRSNNHDSSPEIFRAGTAINCISTAGHKKYIIGIGPYGSKNHSDKAAVIGDSSASWTNAVTGC